MVCENVVGSGIKSGLYTEEEGKIMFEILTNVGEAAEGLAANLAQSRQLMEDAKSGYLEITFGGNHKEIQIGDIHIIVFSNSCLYLSVLSVDRWRLWTLSGKDFGNIIWPVSVTPWIKRVHTKNWNIIWTIHLKYLSLEEVRSNEKFRSLSLPDNWLSKFDIKELYTNDLTTNINYSPNFIRIKLMNLLNNELSTLPIIDFKEY